MRIEPYDRGCAVEPSGRVWRVEPRIASILAILTSRRMLVTLLCGFSSGMPLFVLYQLVPAWLRDNGVDLKTIGLFALVGLPYNWKFLWSPAMDAWRPPGTRWLFGEGGTARRKGWALWAQLGCLLAIAALSTVEATEPPLLEFAWPLPWQDDPAAVFSGSIHASMVVAALLALASASQDIVLDAYRRELLPDEELGLGNSLFVNAYRLSSLVPGSLALILADHLPWSSVMWVVAAFMLVGVAATVLMPEVDVDAPPARGVRDAVVVPLRAFVERHGRSGTLALLSFLLLYKLGDSMATALATPFYLDCGFTKTEIGTIVKATSLWASLVGGTLGGLWMLRIGIHKALWLFGFVQLGSIFGFAWLALLRADPTPLFPMGDADGWVVTYGHAGLAAVVAFEYLGVGLGTAALVAFMARSTDRRFTATQLALLTSLSGLPRTFANAGTGWLVESLGWPTFFVLCGVLAVPGMLMLPRVAPWGREPGQEAAAGAPT